MVFISDGNGEIGAHIRSNLCYLICLRHFIDGEESQIRSAKTCFFHASSYRSTMLLFICKLWYDYLARLLTLIVLLTWKEIRTSLKGYDYFFLILQVIYLKTMITDAYIHSHHIDIQYTASCLDQRSSTGAMGVYCCPPLPNFCRQCPPPSLHQNLHNLNIGRIKDRGNNLKEGKWALEKWI